MVRIIKTHAGAGILALFMMSSCGPAPAMSVSKKENTGPHFYFVQITDTHFGVNNNETRTRNVVDAINRLPMKIEFVAHTGDITQEKMENEAVLGNGISLLKEMGLPVHYVPGNHDIIRRKHDVTASIYKKHFGELISRKEYCGVLFLFIYTEPLAKNFKLQDYNPLEALDKALGQSGGKPAIILHHTPSVGDFYKNRMHSGWDDMIREQWVSVINKYNVKCVIAGHFHRDEHHWLGKVPLYVSSSVGDTLSRGRQPTFRIYEYKNGRVGYRTQYVK